jgi:peroxiredoxin
LAHLRGLVKLRHLDLTGTRVTDAGIVHLGELDELSQLELDGTQVTDRSFAARLANRPGTLISVGDSAPDVSLTRLDRTDVRLSELRGKVVCLNFFATWCGPCRGELPHLQEMWEELHDNEDFTMLIVSREESQETVTSFKSEQRFTFPMACDPDRSAFNQFATEGIPRTYLISRDGTILYQSTGYFEGLYEQELARLKHLVDQQLKTLPRGVGTPRGKDHNARHRS